MKKLFTLLFILQFTICNAQPACPTDPNNPVPLDSAYIVLLIGGALLAIYIINKEKIHAYIAEKKASKIS